MSPPQYKNNRIKSSYHDTSFTQSWNIHGTTYLVYFTAIKCKETCIGGSTVLQTSIILWPQWSWATLKRERGLLSTIMFIMMRYRYRQAKDAHTLICIHRHTVLCVYMHTEIKLLVCMLAHTYACAYKDTYTWTNYLFCWGSLINYSSAVTYVHRCGVQSLQSLYLERPPLASISSHK